MQLRSNELTKYFRKAHPLTSKKHAPPQILFWGAQYYRTSSIVGRTLSTSPASGEVWETATLLNFYPSSELSLSVSLSLSSLRSLRLARAYRVCREAFSG